MRRQPSSALVIRVAGFFAGRLCPPAHTSMFPRMCQLGWHGENFFGKIEKKFLVPRDRLRILAKKTPASTASAEEPGCGKTTF